MQIELVDRTTYDYETRAKDNAWDALMDGFSVRLRVENDSFVVETYGYPGSSITDVLDLRTGKRI